MVTRKYLKQLSPSDGRDYKLFRILPQISIVKPKRYKVPYFGKVKDQGAIGSCVAHSCSELRETLEFIQYLMEEYKYTSLQTILMDLSNGILVPTADDLTHYHVFSVGFIYGNRVVPSGEDPEGMMPRDALKALVKDGDVHQIDFPENDTYPVVRKLFLTRAADLMSKATAYRPTAFAGLSTVDEIQIALMVLGPVTIGIPVYPSFENVGADGIIPMPNTDKEELLGYHEITIFGWDEVETSPAINTFDTLNHWSDEWGDHGWCHMPFAYFSLKDVEMWSTTDTLLPDVNPVPTPPTVNNFIVALKKTFKSSSSASKFLKTISLKGINLTVKQTSKTVFVIVFGEYPDKQSATAQVAIFGKLGYIVSVRKE